MKRSHKKVCIGILGCGAIGSRIARSCRRELKNFCELTALYDTQLPKALELARKLGHVKLAQRSTQMLLKKSDLVVEATSASHPETFIRQAIRQKKNVLVMSVGKVLKHPGLFTLARKNRCRILVPSGAIAGIDALKAARCANIRRITLTTRKPLAGFKGNPILARLGIDSKKAKGETLIYNGGVDRAVKYFPQNINVAATLALASGDKKKIHIRILTSSAYKLNSHEVEIVGNFGRILTRTENTVCPDNPKTSYLAVLSAIATLKNFCEGAGIGT